MKIKTATLSLVLLAGIVNVFICRQMLHNHRVILQQHREIRAMWREIEDNNRVIHENWMEYHRTLSRRRAYEQSRR